MRSILAIVIFAAASAPALAATTVAANNAALTTIGTFGPGKYRVTTPGTVDLAGGGAFVVDANGKPATTITSPGYGYCNPNGCDTDIFSGGAYGQAGPGINLGALAGTIDGGASYFLLGANSTFTLFSTVTLSAVVNDTFYANNVGAFETSIAAVPEPATWTLMIAGVAFTGIALRRRRAGNLAA